MYNAYLLTLGSMLVLAGPWATFMVAYGLDGFAGASVLCALAPTMSC